jgi:plastocyanin
MPVEHPRTFPTRMVAAGAAIGLVGLAAVPSSAATDSAAATCKPDGTSLTVTAFDGKFDRKCLAAPAGTAFTIHFNNLDRGLPHNVALYTDATSRKALFKGELVPGPGFASYSVPALPAGIWYFRCDPHPDMNGTFVVGQ